MNAVGLHIVPVLGGNQVRDGITGVVKHHLWIAGQLTQSADVVDEVGLGRLDAAEARAPSLKPFALMRSTPPPKTVS